MGCCTPAKWKRERIEGHQFDLIDVDDFVEDSCSRQMSYSWVYAVTLKSILVYMADIGIVVLLFFGDNLFSSERDRNGSNSNTSDASTKTENDERGTFEKLISQVRQTAA